ncbi:MAG TPA: hypothetical protein VKQ28_00730 [Candidatus Acidoferrum sp.]|nr:hypothetical protein [Candidatus Acidoferrum sp.]
MELPELADREAAGRILENLNRAADAKDSYEVQQWRLLAEAQDLRIRLDARKWLYDKRDGKATQPVEVAGRKGGPAIIFDVPSAVARRGK